MGNFFAHTENWLMVGLILLQIFVFIYTYKRIGLLQSIFVKQDDFSLQYSDKLKIVTNSQHHNPIYSEIEQTINTYLYKNKGAATDFSMVKDITERHCEMEVDNIQALIPIPLYIGLVGTMLGIIIGLFKIPDLSVVLGGNQTDDLLGNSITLLLGGVKTAMIASACGLLLTTIHSGLLFKTGKLKMERGKNGFFNFIQTELLPQVNKGIGSILHTLQDNLNKFNNGFGENVRQMHSAMQATIRDTEAQAELIREIKELDVHKMTNASITVLQETRQTVAHMQTFNQYLGNINALSENSSQVLVQINELLKRNDNFNAIAENIGKQMTDSTAVMAFFNTHFKNLDAFQKMLQESVSKIDVIWNKSLEELQHTTMAKIQSIKEIAIRQEDYVRMAVEDGRDGLGNLKYLKEINSKIESKITDNTQINIYLKKILDTLDKMSEVEKEKVQAEDKNSKISWWSRQWEKIKRL